MSPPTGTPDHDDGALITCALKLLPILCPRHCVLQGVVDVDAARARVAEQLMSGGPRQEDSSVLVSLYVFALSRFALCRHS